MNNKQYTEMLQKLNELNEKVSLASKKIFVFGHCGASLELIDLLEDRGVEVTAILDNNKEKNEINYKNISVISPERIGEYTNIDSADASLVLITSRFYPAMAGQLERLGYKGQVRKLVDFNSYAEYSLSEDTKNRMTARRKRGEELKSGLEDRYPGYFKVFCPFNALGDIYLMMSYWPAFAASRKIGNAVFCVTSSVLKEVIGMFNDYPVEVYEQAQLDAMVQAVLYTHDMNAYIAHQDRPYIINLQRALYVKKISFEAIYCCGVYGLSKDTHPCTLRKDLPTFEAIDRIPYGKSVIFSPYAKSVPALSPKIWETGVKYYTDNGYTCFTNVAGDEKPLPGTTPISPKIAELISVVEHAGIFVGIRSGLCDILREAKAYKVALYPDYYYSDTKWKAADIYYLDRFDKNIVVKDDFSWEKI